MYMKNLTETDITTDYQKNIFTQDYSKKELIDDVQIININNFVGEDGDFSELVRLNEKGEIEQVPGFQVRQISRTKLFPNAIKGWHLHFKQEDLWYVFPHSHVLVGLVDLRENSSTKNLKMRLVMGGGKSQLLYIPRGVAHGVVNLSPNMADLIYFTNQTFNIEDPDEKRLHWDTFGREFWEYTKD